MSKQWYYELMGSPVGPISSADLKHKVEQGVIQPDTPIRLGPDGKWQSADRVKGLLAPPPQPPAAVAPEPAPEAVAPENPPEARPVVESSASAERTMPLYGANESESASDADSSGEYDFFRFVGFEQALGTGLHQVLCTYCAANHITLTQATRLAIAKLVDREDLLEVPAPPSPAAS